MRSLKEESREATKHLEGRKVKAVVRNKPSEVLIQFTDGSRLFIDISGEELELSITGVEHVG